MLDRADEINLEELVSDIMAQLHTATKVTRSDGFGQGGRGGRRSGSGGDDGDDGGCDGDGSAGVSSTTQEG